MKQTVDCSCVLVAGHCDVPSLRVRVRVRVRVSVKVRVRVRVRVRTIFLVSIWGSNLGLGLG